MATPTPEVTQTFLQILVASNGFWLFIGIIVGAAIELLVRYFLKWREKRKDLKNLKFEIQMNILKVDKWLGYIEKYRKELSTDTVEKFYHYLDFSKSLFIITNKLAISGELYSILKVEDIEKLQENISSLSVNMENIVNNEIRDNMNEVKACKQAQENYEGRPYLAIKEEIATRINFYEQKLQTCKKNYEDVLKSLNSKNKG